jgi:N-methylhydantoinase B/oxoprolinase/acetone carboxylase alpha subunit
MAIDLITLEVLRNKFDVIADEMEIALLKSAYSSIVKEGMDASAALFTTAGETIAPAALFRGVVLEEATLTVDEAATQHVRTTARQQRQH